MEVEIFKISLVNLSNCAVLILCALCSHVQDELLLGEGWMWSLLPCPVSRQGLLALGQVWPAPTLLPVQCWCLEAAASQGCGSAPHSHEVFWGKV